MTKIVWFGEVAHRIKQVGRASVDIFQEIVVEAGKLRQKIARAILL